MTQQPPPLTDTNLALAGPSIPRTAADDPRLPDFITSEDHEDTHIVDTLIRERCPKLSAHWSWPILRGPLFTMLGYSKARQMADEISSLKTGRDCFDYLERMLELKTRVSGLDYIPKSGRVMIVSNHPTGLADGGAIWAALKQKRQDIEIFANADACRVNTAFADIIIPVEWVDSKRTPSKTRETLRRAAESFRAERCLVIFPSGRLALKQNGRLQDRDWFPTAVSLARKNKTTIIPVNMRAQNSHLFYALANISQELKDITLFRELLNKGRAPFDITFGAPIYPDRLVGDPVEITQRLKRHVESDIRVNAEKHF